MASVDIGKVDKFFGTTQVLHGVEIDIGDGEFVVLVGPSGCGKSTLLRMIAGLEEISRGRDPIGGRVVNNVPPKDRDIAMVFQNYALYPHMTVRDNMAFSLKLAQAPKAEINERVGRAAEILGPRRSYLDRYPRQLSGGQRQRVAMGRAIVRDPQVFLFDEPLSNLDAKLRVQMRTEIKELHQRLKTTTIYVTHDQIEAMTMADRIVVMHDGVVEQVGAPLELYDTPANLFVAGFIGSPAMNFIEATIAAQWRRAVGGRRRMARAAAAGAGRRPRRPAGRLRHPARAPGPRPTAAGCRPRSWWSSRPAPRSWCSPSSPGRRSRSCSRSGTSSRRATRSAWPRTPARSTCSTSRPGSASRADARAPGAGGAGRAAPATLGRLAASIERPRYDRTRLSVGIVHLGIGAFHRAHQAVYTEDALDAAPGGWGICGVSACAARRCAMRSRPRTGSTRVAVRGAGGERLRVVGAVKRLLVAPEDPEARSPRWPTPRVAIVTLTVTEKATATTRRPAALDEDHPDIRHDLAIRRSRAPRSGFLVAALRAPARRGCRPFTVLCCDNLPHNGRTVARARARLRGPARRRRSADWIAARRRLSRPRWSTASCRPRPPDDRAALDARSASRTPRRSSPSRSANG